MIKNQARNEYFDLDSSGIEKRKYNVITAKFRPMLYGDADSNGKADFADVLRLKRYLAGWDKYGEANNIPVDLDGGLNDPRTSYRRMEGVQRTAKDKLENLINMRNRVECFKWSAAVRFLRL